VLFAVVFCTARPPREQPTLRGALAAVSTAQVELSERAWLVESAATVRAAIGPDDYAFVLPTSALGAAFVPFSHRRRHLWRFWQAAVRAERRGASALITGPKP